MAIYQKIYLVVHPMLSPKIWGPVALMAHLISNFVQSFGTPFKMRNTPILGHIAYGI